MRFELIDQVLERSADRLVGLKNVSRAEEYLADHFPGFPVLPGVLMMEVMVQAGRLLLEALPGVSGPLVLAEARNIRYGSMVRPGQSLRVEVNLRGGDAQAGWELAGVGKVNDDVAVQGRFRLVPLTTGAGPGTMAHTTER